MTAWHSNLNLFWLTPRLCRVLMSIPQTLFMWEERKASWDNEMKLPNPSRMGKWLFQAVIYCPALLRTRSGIPKAFLTHSNFLMIQLEPKSGHFWVSFHPSPHHLKLSCQMYSGLFHCNCYCHGLAGWHQPLCFRLCSAPWHFASCKT